MRKEQEPYFRFLFNIKSITAYLKYDEETSFLVTLATYLI